MPCGALPDKRAKLLISLGSPACTTRGDAVGSAPAPIACPVCRTATSKETLEPFAGRAATTSMETINGWLRRLGIGRHYCDLGKTTGETNLTLERQSVAFPESTESGPVDR